MLIGLDASRAVTDRRTGTEAYALRLIRSLIPIAASRGHQINLYFNQSPPPGLFPEDQIAHHVLLPFPRFWTHFRLAWSLHRRPPDIFFTPAHVIPVTYRRPSVATVHDLGYHYFPKSHHRKQQLYLAWSTRHNARRGRRVIADSTTTKNDLVRLYGIDPSKVDVIYPGLDPAIRPVTDAKQREVIRRKYGIGSPYLLFISTLQPRKNLARLIEGFAACKVEHYLVLAGKEGWLAGSIIAQIEGLPPPVRNRLLMPGFIDDEDKAALISGADALLYPSLYEGFGFPVLEGQACCTPVLCSNTSSLPEIAGDGALFVDPLSTLEITRGIERLTSDTDLRQRLIKTGLANSQRFDWQTTATGVMDVLEKAAV